MPRRLSVPSQVYEAGTYGPLSVDSFTNANTEKLVLTLTCEGWPQDADPLLTVMLLWDTGHGVRVPIPGRQVNKDGSPKTSVHVEVDVPRVAGGKKGKVAGGAVTVDAHAALRTAVTLEAV